MYVHTRLEGVKVIKIKYSTEKTRENTMELKQRLVYAESKAKHLSAMEY